jgi:hypothetical protein
MTDLDHCLAYLSKLPPSVSGSGGHNATLRAACECVRFGLTDDEGMLAMGEYNRRCSPPWSECELAHKLESARRIASNQAGTRAPRGQRPKTARAFDQAALERRLREMQSQIIGDTQTPPNVEELAKLPYRRPMVAIPPATLAAAMARAFEAVEQLPGFAPGVPIVGQAVELEEEYWRHVWRRLGRPDPALTNQTDQD